MACRYSIGRMLTPEEFSGGEAPGQANYVLGSWLQRHSQGDEDEEKPAIGQNRSKSDRY